VRVDFIRKDTGQNKTMRPHNKFTVAVAKYNIQHMRRCEYSEEYIYDTLVEKGYTIETILDADKLTNDVPLSK